MLVRLSEQQLSVAKAASQDSHRGALTAVKICKGTIVASDGFILVRRKIEYQGDEEILVSAKDLLSCKPDDTGTLVLISDKLNPEVVHTFGAAPKDIKAFPPPYRGYEHLFSTGDAMVEMRMNREVLLRLLDVLNKENESYIRFRFYGPDLPIQFSADREHTDGLIAPWVGPDSSVAEQAPADLTGVKGFTLKATPPAA